MTEEDKSVVLSKRFLHEALTRKGWFLPKKSGGFVTLRYLDAVFKGTYWVPRYADVILAPCPRPPEIKILYGEVENLLQQKSKTLGDTTKGMPDKIFLLTCLSTLSPQHQFFSADYLPPTKHRRPPVSKDLSDY